MRRPGILWAVLLFAVFAGFALAQDEAEQEPLVATIRLGGTETLWLDPTFVSVLSGVVNTDAVQAIEFGEDCVGVVTERPEVVLEWTEDETVDKLRIFFTSNGDATLVIVTPDGTALCADDLNPLELDPMVEIENPATGRYQIYVGNFEGDVILPGFLVFTSGEYSPATLDVAAFAPELSPDAVPLEIPLGVLHLNEMPTADPASTELEVGFETYTQSMSTSGNIAAFNIDFDSDRCTGFIDSVPTFAFNFTGESDALRVFYEGDHDSTLVIRTPGGSFACADDSAGADNLNPLIDLQAAAGEYLVFIGSFEPGETVSGTLTITEDLSAEPTPLVAADLADEE